jgi:hypothetical protein
LSGPTDAAEEPEKKAGDGRDGGHRHYKPNSHHDSHGDTQLVHERLQLWLVEQLRSLKDEDESRYGESQRQDDDSKAGRASGQQPPTAQLPGRFARQAG